jgi:hypothetical protein
MRIRHTSIAAVLAAGLGGLIAPALAQGQSPAGNAPDQGRGMSMDRSMGHDMTGRGMMDRGMMSGGCSGMMQSMNGGGGRPNSQWRHNSPSEGTPD